MEPLVCPGYGGVRISLSESLACQYVISCSYIQRTYYLWLVAFTLDSPTWKTFSTWRKPGIGHQQVHGSNLARTYLPWAMSKTQCVNNRLCADRGQERKSKRVLHSPLQILDLVSHDSLPELGNNNRLSNWNRGNRSNDWSVNRVIV